MISVEELSSSGDDSVHSTESSLVIDALDVAPSPVTVLRLDGSSISSERDLLKALADTFDFPAYFGQNWDAVDECLRDLSWLDGDGYVLVVDHATSLVRNAGEGVAALIRSWVFANHAWRRDGVPFHLLLLFDDATAGNARMD